MIGSTRKPKATPKNEESTLPKGLKVAAPPKSAAGRDLLAEPDIETSGGCNVVHFKHFVGVGDQIFFVIDVFPSADPGGYRVEIIPLPLDPAQRSVPQIESIRTTTSTRQEAGWHGRTTYAQAIVEARTLVTERFKGYLAELAARECKANIGKPDFQRPDFKFEIVEARDWKKQLQRLRSEGKISDEWVKAVAKETKSKLLREALCELMQLHRTES